MCYCSWTHSLPQKGYMACSRIHHSGDGLTSDLPAYVTEHSQDTYLSLPQYSRITFPPVTKLQRSATFFLVLVLSPPPYYYTFSVVIQSFASHSLGSLSPSPISVVTHPTPSRPRKSPLTDEENNNTITQPGRTDTFSNSARLEHANPLSRPTNPRFHVPSRFVAPSFLIVRTALLRPHHIFVAVPVSFSRPCR